MKFNTIIIGGGLSALAAGITLRKAGQQVAIITAGESTLHFNGGSIDLLGYDVKGNAVKQPLQAIAELPETHPYHRVNDVEAKAIEAAALLKEAGYPMTGEANHNQWRLTPIGLTKPTWLTTEGMVTCKEGDRLPWKSVTVVDIIGFLDAPLAFLIDNIAKAGVEVERVSLSTPQLSAARLSPSEMRATNLAKVLARPGALNSLANALNNLSPKGEVVLLPAVLGLEDPMMTAQLKRQVKHPLAIFATMPPSVPGVCLQNHLRRHFVKLGGTLLTNHTVTDGQLNNGHLAYVKTDRLVEEKLEAENFILATGSFQSRGLRSDYTGITEPIFGLDVDVAEKRSDWTADYVFDDQPYMRFGVKTDDQLHVSKDGHTISNLYAAGAILSGNDPIRQADAEGVALLTGLQAAHNILK